MTKSKGENGAKLRITAYTSNNNLYVEQIGMTEDDSPLGSGKVLSVPNAPKLGLYEAYIDTASHPNALKYIVESGSGVPQDKRLKGNEAFVLVKFNPNILKAMDSVGDKSYVKYNDITADEREQAVADFKKAWKSLCSKEKLEEYKLKGIQVPVRQRRSVEESRG